MTDRLDNASVAELIGISPNTFSDWRVRGHGEGPSWYRYANRIFYRRDDLPNRIEVQRIVVAKVALP